MGLAGYLDSLDLSPQSRARLASYATDEPPPPPPTDSRVETVQPDIHSRPAVITPHDEANPGTPPGPGLNWKRAGERVQAGASALGHAAEAIPGASALGQTAGRAVGKAGVGAVRGDSGPATEDTGEGLSQEMLDNRKRVAKELAGGGGGDEEEEGQGGPRLSQGTPGHLVGAQWVPGTRNTQYGIDESKLEPGQKLRAEGKNHAEWALDKTQEAAAREAAGDVAYAAAHAQAVQDAAARAQRIENEKQAYVIREHEKLDALNTAAQAQVDPEAAKGSSGAQLFAALSVALGQFGASINGGTNTALQIVNGNIDRRIAAQQANINNAHKSLANEQSLYKDNLEAFGDKERAALATKMQYLDQAKAQLDQVYAAAKTNRNEAAYHAMREGLDEKYAGYADQFGIRTADQRSGTEHFERAHMEGGTAGGGGKDLPNLVEHNGTTYQLPNEKEHAKTVTEIQTLNKLQRYDNDALKARAKIRHLNAVTDRTAYLTELGTLKDLEDRKVSLISTSLQQGVLRDPEYWRSIKQQSFYTAGIGGLNEINPLAGPERDAGDANIRRQIARSNSDTKAFIHAAGGRIVESGYAHDASGNLTPVAKYTGQNTRLAETLPPRGSRSMKADQETPTADEPDINTTDAAPDFGLAPAGSSARKGDKGAPVKRRK